jgi:hypothetical protein
MLASISARCACADVVLEQAARELVVLVDRHVGVAREVVVAQASQPGAQRRAPQHRRPHLRLQRLERAALVVPVEEGFGTLPIQRRVRVDAPVVHRDRHVVDQ